VQDPGGRETTAQGDVSGIALAAIWGAALAGQIEDVEFTAGGWLDGEFGSGVMRDVVPIHDVVVPVSLTGLEHGALETEGTLPGAGLESIPRERELAVVVVPGTEKVDSLDISRSAEREIQL